jgi:hypothetical protein
MGSTRGPLRFGPGSFINECVVEVIFLGEHVCLLARSLKAGREPMSGLSGKALPQTNLKPFKVPRKRIPY